MIEQRIKTEVVRMRITAEEKQLFTSICNRKAINQSELLRQLVRKWITEQLDDEKVKK